LKNVVVVLRDSENLWFGLRHIPEMCQSYKTIDVKAIGMLPTNSHRLPRDVRI
jgi:hypothetical protein